MISIAEEHFNKNQHILSANEYKKVMIAKSREGKGIVVNFEDKVTTEQIKNYYYVYTELRKQGIKVPEVYDLKEDKKKIIFQHCGEVLSNKSDLKERVEEVLEEIILLNNISSDKLKENVLDLGFKEILSHFIYANRVLKVEVNSGFTKKMLETVRYIAGVKKVFLHGDIHFDNLVYDGKDYYFIDLGLAQIGPYLYDIVCLFNDPRLDLTWENRIQYLKDKFKEKNLITDYGIIEFYRNYYTLATFKELYIETNSKKYKGYYNKLLLYMKKQYLNYNNFTPLIPMCKVVNKLCLM